jgi:hypothetical protein
MYGPVACSCEHANERSGSIKEGRGYFLLLTIDFSRTLPIKGKGKRKAVPMLN